MAGISQRLAFLGCGHMGKAVLKGLLRANETSASPAYLFEAAVSNDASAQRLRSEFGVSKDLVHFRFNANLQAAQGADVVLLCFPPDQLQPILSEPGMADAVQGKLIISILAGVAPDQIKEQLKKSSTETEGFGLKHPHIVRVMPSLGAQAYESATLIVAEEPPLPSHLNELTVQIFKHIGPTYSTPGHLCDSVTALTAVCHGLMAVAVDALIDGSAAAGIPRHNAVGVLGQCFRGYSTLVARGDEPAELKKSLLIPKGITAQAILKLEREGVRSAISDSVVDAVAYANSMGKR